MALLPWCLLGHTAECGNHRIQTRSLYFSLFGNQYEFWGDFFCNTALPPPHHCALAIALREATSGASSAARGERRIASKYVDSAATIAALAPPSVVFPADVSEEEEGTQIKSYQREGRKAKETRTCRFAPLRGDVAAAHVSAVSGGSGSRVGRHGLHVGGPRGEVAHHGAYLSERFFQGSALDLLCCRVSTLLLLLFLCAT